MKLTDNQLIEELEQWFLNNKNNTWRTPLGLYIKSKLQAANHWKDLPRGNAVKGLRAMRASMVGERMVDREDNEL